MTLQQLYALAVQLGIQADPRGLASVKRQLKQARIDYNKLSAQEKPYFDQEYFTNPYSDSRILYSSSDTKPIKRAIAGIDCSESELLLADRLGKVDLAITHHPEGIALADLHSVMDVQVEMLSRVGVPIHIAESLLAQRIAEVNRGLQPINDHKTVDVARLLNISYMATHTITDNMVTTFIDELVKKNQKKLYYVGDVMDLLMTIPEYQIAKKLKSGPSIFIGHGKRRAGRIAVTEMTGGTNGAKEMFERLSNAGIGTVIGMHMREEYRKEAEKHHINVVIAGHVSSDSVGMNLMLDQFEQRGVEIIPLGGLIRVKRFKAKR
ncbi:MAG: NGG1p interacting factor NIF3 [Candidatus Kerfeldbacteria bacterium]|nr:NGG1p interacting factor NIF3 [Candidatus Kerfeldbacteria bacterium]